jgi:hypothetical protein
VPLTPPLVPVFPAGYGPLPADMNNWIQSSLGFQSTGVVFRAEQRTSQSLTSGVNNTIAFNTILEDPYAGWNSGSSEWIAPFTGLYAVNLTPVTTIGGGPVGAVINTSGVGSAGGKTAANNVPNNLPGGASGTDTIFVVAGGFIQGQVFVDTTSITLNSFSEGFYTSMDITFISQ